ncbi:uncharacterized protein CFAP97D2-like [Leucoraja erinacea]|uniref:uncharacterized protein CFAP97D2-like n=1 Tax=Leucoraja erinaceus TaxID=7782 RepID=UPI002453FDEF|nr:uncharacterized protein CFAP97D2-like [Leucoraja erinacea]
MHRSYQPILPCGNKYLQQKWDHACYLEHRRKVQAAKPTVDNNAPEIFSHLQLKFKKLKLEDERLSNIERNNKKLQEKMSTIMRTTGRVDNINVHKPKSLNKEMRQREMQRVTRENQAMQERLKQVEPQYNHLKWLEDWYKSEKYENNIARYPRAWYTAQRLQPKSKARKVKSAKNSVKSKRAQVRTST